MKYYTCCKHCTKMAVRLLFQAGRMQNSTMWRILIIEDERVDREIYKRYLRHSTASQLDFAESGSAAAGLEMSRSWVPDCILLDFNLRYG